MNEINPRTDSRNQTRRSLAEKAAELAAKTHKLEEPRVVDRAEVLDPKTGTPLYLFRVVNSASANKPAHAVILNERGENRDQFRAQRAAKILPALRTITK